MGKTSKEENKTVSKELLESCRNALYKVKETFDDIVNADADDLEVEDRLKLAETIIKITSGLGKSIETLAILEKKVEQEEEINNKRRGGGKSSLYEE